MKDVILHLPNDLFINLSQGPNNTSKPKDITILFFITGNPGLIGYYDTFLNLLAQHQNLVVAGASLGGFFTFAEQGITTPTTTSTTEDEIKRQLLLPDGFVTKDVYTLRDQIDLCYCRVSRLVRNLRERVHGNKGTNFRVILGGHSVGAYIALELVRLHYEESGMKQEEEKSEIGRSFEIVATFLLTPTIHDISGSSSGRIAAPLLKCLPFFPSLLQLGAFGVSTVLSRQWLRNLVGRVTGMRNPSAIATTVDFLCTPGAVRQALYMADCEMREIGEDKWTDEVWGAVDAAEMHAADEVSRRWMAPRHFFLFAKEDHWVANATRETIAERMRDRAVVLIDEGQKGDLNHAWCLQQSDIVAEIVSDWIDEVVEKL